MGRVVSLGAGARVGPRAVVDRSVLLSGAVVEEGALVEDSILGPRARIGRAASVRGCVLAEGASVPQGARLAGARVSAFEVAAARGAIPSGP